LADDHLDQIRAYYVTLREVIILNPADGTTPNRASAR
jgi:hypothetical protein